MLKDIMIIYWFRVNEKRYRGTGITMKQLYERELAKKVLHGITSDDIFEAKVFELIYIGEK